MKACFCCSRRMKLGATKAPKEIKTLFEKYSENGIMTASFLQQFLVDEQKEDETSIRDAQSIIDSLRHLYVFRHTGINLEGFFKYLFGDLNFPLPPKDEVQQDMSAPLSHYFIYTGHNSYLTGNQLTSTCSDTPIIDALQESVRVIELDVWPNSSKEDVDVLHGGTMTARIELIKCLTSIEKFAFSTSKYPVVVTLEDHLSTDLQAKAAEMITHTFGEALFLPDTNSFREFPSPDSLQKRVMISTKPPNESDDPKDEATGNNSQANDHKEVRKTKKAPEYKRLIAIHAGKPKGGLKEALRIDPNKVRRLSLSEAEVQNAVDAYGKEIIRFTQREPELIHPTTTLFLHGHTGLKWLHFNMQGYGKKLWLMQGMFRANGGCGYVKKPQFLMETGPDGEVNVYMGEGWYHDFQEGHCDKFSPPDLYLKIGIVGVAADKMMKKTKTLEDNWVPSWDEEFEFLLRVPEFALLRIEVHEYDMNSKDDFAGQTCLPIWELKQGIRCVPLYDYEGHKYRSTKLLMRFEFLSP